MKNRILFNISDIILFIFFVLYGYIETLPLMSAKLKSVKKLQMMW